MPRTCVVRPHGWSPTRFAALNNCAFVSTENLKGGIARPFCFLMDASMLGVGVGFDTKVRCVEDVVVVWLVAGRWLHGTFSTSVRVQRTCFLESPPLCVWCGVVHCAVLCFPQGAGTVMVRGHNPKHAATTFVVPDSREGWVDSVRMLLNSIVEHRAAVEFDYSAIRPAGTPIKGFGGTCSGAASLQTLHQVRL